MIRIIMALLVTVMIAAILFLLMSKKDDGEKAVHKRIELLSTPEPDETDGKEKSEEFREQFMKFVGSIASTIRGLRSSGYLDFKMQQADWPLLGSEFQVILGIMSLVVGIFLFLLTLQFSMFFIGAVGTILVGLMYLKLHISRRQAAFVNQLGDTLVMVSNALRAGFSFLQAMEYISREMNAPIGTEFQKVVNEMNLGSPLEVSLENMGKRMESKDFDLVVTAVLIQRQVGGNLSQVLDSISNTINERIRMRREIMTLTAQGRLSGVIVGAIPFAMIGLALSMNSTYFDQMLADKVGRILAGVAAGLEIAAVLVIRKIVDIKL